MQIIFSDHAIERMYARNISKLEVYATIKSPQEKMKSYRDRIIYKRRLKDKILEVITKKENNLTIIISTYVVK